MICGAMSCAPVLFCAILRKSPRAGDAEMFVHSLDSSVLQWNGITCPVVMPALVTEIHLC
jgi:hypothetical protein